jgi:alpha-amylase
LASSCLQKNNGGFSVGYDPYDLLIWENLTRKEALYKIWNKEQYIEAIQALRKNIQVIVDIVLNHKAGGDELEKFNVVKVDENDRKSNLMF